MLKAKHTEALENRGINVEIASGLGWTSSSKGDWLEIPYKRKGHVVGTKYRTLTGDKKFMQNPGSEQCFWNVDILGEIGTAALVICEGEMDAMIALQCGYMAVSVPNGAPANIVEGDGKKYDYLKDIPDTVKEIILAVDGDAAGTNLLHDLSLRLNPARCKWVKYPKGCKDLNDAFLAGGDKGQKWVDETLKRAQWCKVEGLYRMSDIPPSPHAEPIACPVDGMGYYYKLRLGDFTVVSGVPGMGKTIFTNEIACGMARHNGWHVAVASFEQDPKQDHLRALRTYHSGKMVKDMTQDEIDAADAWIDESFTFVIPHVDDEVDLKWMLSKMEAAIIRQNAKLIIVDPWNEMDHNHPDGMTITQYTGFAIKQFKKLARKYMVHVIVVAHPAKMQRDKNGKYPIPSLYDIADSSHWANKPDIGIIVHRDKKSHTIVKVAKIRYWGVIGHTGEVNLEYNPSQSRFIARPDLASDKRD